MPVKVPVCRCLSGAGWESASHAWSAWWKATFAICAPASNTTPEPAFRPVSRPPRVIARSTSNGYSQVTYGFVGYDSVGLGIDFKTDKRSQGDEDDGDHRRRRIRASDGRRHRKPGG